MVTAVAYLYPWDVLGDPHAPERIAALGADRVALAAAYHAVRAATPHHPRRRIVHAEHSALYLPVRPVWQGRPLSPRRATAWTGHDDAFGAARDLLHAHGLPVDAWVVLTHRDDTGGPVVRNAFGDRYPYALCPAGPAVRDYARTLVGEVLEIGRPDGLMIEACGPMGAGHQSAHEKTAGADWTAVDEALLSTCFCATCLRILERGGVDTGRARTRVTAAVGAGHRTLGTALGDLAAGLLAARTATVAALRDDVFTTARTAGVTRLGVFADADPWATGPSAAVTSGADLYVAAAWDHSPARLTALRRETASTVGAYVTILPPTPPDPGLLTAKWQALIDAGAAELHIYHAGLASAERLDAAARALRRVKGESR